MPPAPAQAQPGKGPPSSATPRSSNCCANTPSRSCKAAGLAQQNIQVVIINDRSFNAFVADGRRIFVNAGALMEAQTPNQIIGVLAHETGAHRRRASVAHARATGRGVRPQSIIAMLLGVGAMVAGRRAAAMPACGQAGMAMIQGAAGGDPELAVLLSCAPRRTRPTAPAVKFLTATDQSAKGMYETFKRLADQILFTARYTDPYMQSHPLPSERVAALEGIAQQQPVLGQEGPAGAAGAPRLMRAKLYGFMDRPRHGGAPLSAERHQPCRPATRARSRPIGIRRSARGRRRRSMR